jgi:transposase-like protein
VSNGKKKGEHKTAWTREFKLRALALMEEAPNVGALAAELGCRRSLLYIWRSRYRAGGAEGLRSIGRRPAASAIADGVIAPPGQSAAASEQDRIAELERKIGQQQLDLDFFRAALRHVRELRRQHGEPGETGSSR